MMYYLAWIVFIITILQLLIALANYFFRERLISKTGVTSFVSILIPARDEEKNIGNILNDIIMQDYLRMEVIVLDDDSSDRTAEVILEFAQRDPRIRLLRSSHLPEGWLGKNWACQTLSEAAKGEFFLFIDADVRIGTGLIYNAISFADRLRLDLVSIFPKQILLTSGEKMSVPNMNYILLSLLPLILVRTSPNTALAAANGQFMLFRANVYRNLLPHRVMKKEKVEDIEIARLMKKQGRRIACLLGDDSIRCRMYTNFRESVHGFSKNVATFFGNSILLAFTFWLITSFGFIVVLNALSYRLFAVYASAYILTRIIISRISEQNILANLLLIIPQQLACGLFIFNSFLNKKIRSFKWKGRELR